MSAPILRLPASQRPVFLVNSRLGLFTAAPHANKRAGHPFSRSYGVILPSSLTRVLPGVLEYSSHLPVSVSGTGTSFLTRGFSWQRRYGHFGTSFPSPSRLSFRDGRICLPVSLVRLDARFQPRACPSFLRPPFAQTERGGTGISTCFPSPTPFGLSLGPD